MVVPPEYYGREQSYLKHRMLTEYLRAWAHKLSSLSQRRPGGLRIWYVDCFAGPWQARGVALQDTSIYIGLEALLEACSTWSGKGAQVQVGALFVEKDDSAFEQLKQYLAQRQREDPRLRDVHALHGEFGAKLQEINERVGDEPAFIFVDPTGWKGAAMEFIRPLLDLPRRDVMVNVMFNHINRFKADPRAFLREQMQDFFGMVDTAKLRAQDEESLLSGYREQLKSVCRVRYAADVAIPHPTMERTWFRLVIGGSHHKVLEVFRDAERAMMQDMAPVRDEARERQVAQRTGQLALGLPMMSTPKPTVQEGSCEAACGAAMERLRQHGGQGLRFDELWPPLLEELHVTRRELAAALWQRREQLGLVVRGKAGARPSSGSRQRTLHDDDVVSAGHSGAKLF